MPNCTRTVNGVGVSRGKYTTLGGNGVFNTLFDSPQTCIFLLLIHIRFATFNRPPAGPLTLILKRSIYKMKPSGLIVHAIFFRCLGLLYTMWLRKIRCCKPKMALPILSNWRISLADSYFIEICIMLFLHKSELRGVPVFQVCVRRRRLSAAFGKVLFRYY